MASKNLSGFLTALKSPKAKTKAIKQLNSPGTQSGHFRLYPSKNHTSDLRIDAGKKVNGKQALHLQVNSEAKSEGLQDWVKKQGSKGTHADLAVAFFDSNSKDHVAELERVADSLKEQAKDSLKSGKAAKY